MDSFGTLLGALPTRCGREREDGPHGWDNNEFQKVIARITDEAADSRLRWKHLHEFKQSLAQLQSIYALTVHKSQGSTIGSVFVDLPDIRRREETNLLEAQQMLYVAVTRPSKRLIVVGT